MAVPSFKGSFRQRLQADVPLLVLAAAGIDWGKRPDLIAITDATGITLNIAALPNDMHFRGPQGRLEATVSIDVWSGVSHEAADAAARRIIAIIQEPATVDFVQMDAAFVDGPEDSGNQEETLYVHRSRLVARVWHALV